MSISQLYLPNPTSFDHIYFQIVVIEYDPKKECNKLSLVTKTKRQFNNFLIKEKPTDETPKNDIGANLPSPGVNLTEDFIATFCGKEETQVFNKSSEINNFYESVRILLISRKISQLIAKTWHSYLKSYNNCLQKKFKDGDWLGIVNSPDVDGISGLNILEGLLAREIFLYDYRYIPLQKLDPDDQSVYNVLHFKKPKEENRFLILPSSRAWPNIAISLLLAGQAYYKIGKEDFYYQISPPILSTGEIVMKYGIDIDWDQSTGIIREISVSPEEYSIAFPMTIPYPAIPSEHNLSSDDIKRWAYAEDEWNDNGFPFYGKPDDKYLPIQNFTPPFPYIPLSCC